MFFARGASTTPIICLSAELKNLFMYLRDRTAMNFVVLGVGMKSSIASSSFVSLETKPTILYRLYYHLHGKYSYLHFLLCVTSQRPSAKNVIFAKKAYLDLGVLDISNSVLELEIGSNSTQ